MTTPLLRADYEIHGLVHVVVETSSGGLLQQVEHQLREFSCARRDTPPDVLITSYERRPLHDAATVISDYYRFSGDLLDIPPERLAFNLVGPTITIYTEKTMLPVNFLVELALLRRGHTLVHAAGVEFQGRRYLFPAFGGIGKTTLVAALVFNGGRLYGDDMCVVDALSILPYPIDFSVYPHHLPVLGLTDPKIRRAFRRTALLDRLTQPLEHANARPLRLARVALNSLKTPCVNVPPRAIFGSGKLAKPGILDEVQFLTRTTTPSSNCTEERMEPERLAGLCTDILLLEWHEHMEHLYLYAALCPSFSLQGIRQQIESILLSLFSTRPCSRITIPADMPNDTYQRQQVDRLRKVVAPNV